MKTSIFITIFSLLSFVCTPLTFAEILPIGVIMPGSSIKIYESFAGPTIVTITVSDYAPGGNSKLIKMAQDTNDIYNPTEITDNISHKHIYRYNSFVYASARGWGCWPFTNAVAAGIYNGTYSTRTCCIRV